MDIYKPKKESEFYRFLDTFIGKSKLDNNFDNNSFPKHSLLRYISKDELKDEVQDWTLQHLTREIKFISYYK